MNTGFKYEWKNNPLYPPFLRGNPSNSKYSQDSPIGARGKNLPLTAFLRGNPSGAPLIRGNSSGCQRLRHLLRGFCLKNLPLTAFPKGGQGGFDVTPTLLKSLETFMKLACVFRKLSAFHACVLPGILNRSSFDRIHHPDIFHFSPNAWGESHYV